MIFNQLVEDIREEPSVWSLKLRPKAEDLEDAWRRIASKNNLSGECGFAKIVGISPGFPFRKLGETNSSVDALQLSRLN